MTSNDPPDDTRMQTDRENGEVGDFQSGSALTPPIASDKDQETPPHRSTCVGKGLLPFGNGISIASPTLLSCFLCMEFTGDHVALRQHFVKNHEVKTEVLEKFMSLIDLSTGDTLLQKRKTGTVKPEVESSELAIDLPAVAEGQPRTTSQLSICDDSDGLVIDLGKDPELVDGESVGAENGALTGVGKETGNDGMEVEPPPADLVRVGIEPASAVPVYACWHSGCHEFFPNAADVQPHYINAHARDREESAVAVTKSNDLQCGQCDQVFRKKEDFNKHRYCHEMDRAVQCSSCQHRFQSIGEFRRHMQVVHREELSPEQQELYEASLAAASSLALLGASGLENMTAQALKRISPLSPGKGKALSGTLRPQALEGQSAAEKMEGRLDENSNSCSQAKFEGDVSQGSGTVRDERGLQKCDGSCGQNGVVSKCPSCRVGWCQANGLLEHHQHTAEKSRRKRSIPTKTITSPPEGERELSPTDLSIMGLTGQKNSSLDSETLVAPSTVAPLPFTSPSNTLHRPQTSVSGADRPFRCAICKVSYSQETQLDSHLSSQQHVSRCAKAVDSTARQAMSSPAAFTSTPRASAEQGSFADVLRRQGFPIVPFLRYGAPFINPLASPVMSGYAVPSTAVQPAQESDVRPSTNPVTACRRNSSDLSSIAEPSSRAESGESGLKSTMNDDSVISSPDLVCTRCGRSFPTAELMNQHHTDCLDATTNILAPDPHSNGKGVVGQTMMESILQKIGFECVKQFNEFRQKPKHQVAPVSTEAGAGTQLDNSDTKDLGHSLQWDGRSGAQTSGTSGVGGVTENENVYFCPTCSKCFSDIFVLKSHQEIVHMEIVPIDVLERLQQDLRAKCEKARTVGGNEDSKCIERSRIRRQNSTTVSFRSQQSEEEESKLKQQQHQQQLQLAAAYQSMQLSLMMSMGMLHQVPQRLPGPAHMAAISELFAQQPFPILDPVMMMQLQQQQQTNKSTSASAMAPQSQLSAAANQKSARTRISEQQLQILRANFDINNSPTEEQIQEMSEKTGLVTKVIKHWFRNTLFKERQRNKDSPYNFNNPPATTLNLEDYEKSQAMSVKKEPSTPLEDGSKTPVLSTAASTSTYTNTRPLTAISEAPAKFKPFCNSEISVKAEGSSSESPTISDCIGKSTISGSSSASSQGNAEFGSGMIRLGAGLSPMTNAIYGLSPPVNWQERRAGRTRFSNQQIQVLQEFFDRNPYPKDDEVESLSRVLGLGIRVIVVWFQNARQRVRKTEGQVSSTSTSESPRKSQYQCGKCPALFDQHLELLRHQMSDHAASGDATSRTASQSDSNEVFVDDEEAASRSSLGNDADHEPQIREGLATASRATRAECDRCDLAFDYDEQLNAHQRTVHGVDSILPRIAAMTQSEFGCRKSSEDGAAFRQSSDDEEHRGGDRRMRTTLVQDQLDYLYEKFAVESNPSRLVLEQIAAHLNLKPRVVQVWFQNTRARERRGQHRVNAQKTTVRCGFCESVFRGKASLDAHVAECHPSHLSAYPVDLAQTIQAMTTSSIEPSVIPPFLPPPSLVGNPMLVNPTLQTNMNYLYEKSLKQYMTKLSNLHVGVNHQTAPSSSSSQSHHVPTTSFEPSKPSTLGSEDVPLDLTTTASASSRSDTIKMESDDALNRSNCYQPSLDDSYSETYSENDCGDSTSPTLGNNPSRHGGAMLSGGKRYRTQMSSLQIKVMRTIFNDYKTPSLAECEVLGQQIGLPRRVVQVWFQNSRAKMKKSCFLGLEKPEGSGSTSSSSSAGFFPGVCVSLSECSLCNVVYGVSHTMQDHLFTKSHIDRVMTAVNKNEFRHSFLNSADGRETESLGRSKSSSSAGDFPSNQSATSFSVNISSSILEPAASNVLSNADRTSVVERRQKRSHERSPKVAKELQNDIKKNAQNNVYPSSSSVPFPGPVESNLHQFLNVPPASAADLMGMMMPYFYQAGGIPAIFPGLGPIQLLSQAPGILPGVPNAMFNPAMCGIQLAQLQIPKRAIELIQDRLKDRTCQRAYYSEDSLSSAELRAQFSPVEFASLSEQTIHVGFICRKCHLVFPQASACNAHQAALCYKDAEKSTGDATLKLEQLVYHCALCKANCSTVAEFKAHCRQERHRKLEKSSDARCGRAAGNNNGEARFDARSMSGEARAAEEEQSRNGESVSLISVKLEKSDG